MEKEKDVYAVCKLCTEVQREIGSFDRDHCRKCKYGFDLHRKEVQEGDPWGDIDWNKRGD